MKNTDILEVTVDHEFRIKNKRPKFGLHNRDIPDARAQFAMQMLERWGCVAAEPDGEDSAGRARLKLANPAALAERACDTAQAAWKEFESRGWLAHLPTMEEAEGMLPEIED